MFVSLSPRKPWSRRERLRYCDRSRTRAIGWTAFYTIMREQLSVASEEFGLDGAMEAIMGTFATLVVFWVVAVARWTCR